MQMQVALHQGQTQSGAPYGTAGRQLSLKEGLEQMRSVFFGNTGTFVYDIQLQLLVLSLHADMYFSARR